MGFTKEDRLQLVRLAEASEVELAASRITDWLSPGFFHSKFWYMWATTFAFQPWHSAVEFKRYLHRFMKEFTRIETLAGVKRTIFNQYDALVRPLESWLAKQGVRFLKACTVTNLDQVNLTDEDSRIMKVAGGGFDQCYDAQAVVATGSMLIVATEVTQATNDKGQLLPMLQKLQALPEEIGRAKRILADNG